MNASCHIPVKSDIPLGYLTPEGFVVFDDTTGVQMLAVMCAKAANDALAKAVA